ncbi:MAG: D-alanyl-D-alanine carboxypeptidase [Treponema sp.]|nr:D-alanyl-D-alanine carboxypeptidase [Treponema sp.]
MNKQNIIGILLLFLWIPCFAAELTDPLYPAALPPSISARSAVLIDGETGTILFSQSPSLVIPPASLTKLMTIHLALRAIQTGKASADDIVWLPPETWADNQPPRSSLMFLGRNQTVTLGELLLGMAVSSGNDAAVAAALHLAPSIEAFVAMMNAEAGLLGLASTRFFEPAGISPENTTTALDFARFCRMYLHKHPESVALLHSVPTFAYPQAVNTGNEPSRTIVQNNRNTLLGISGVDGIKTGYIPEAGNNIALSARRGETRLTVIILGASGEAERDRDGMALLDWGFANFKTMRSAVEYLPDVRIWGSKRKYGALKLGGEPAFTVSARRGGILQINIERLSHLRAPLPAGEQGGTLIISDEMGELYRMPLVLEKEAVRGNFIRVLFDSIALFFQKLFGKS